MPDVGTRLPRPISHTSTHQWQSFEIRMRYRRAERCVLRAEAAIDAGMEEEARAALAEARALNPETPDFDSVRAIVLQRRAAALAATKQARIRRIAAIAGAAIVVVSAAFAMWPASQPVVPDTTIPVAAATSTRPAPVPEPQPTGLSADVAGPTATHTGKPAPVTSDPVAPTSGEAMVPSAETPKLPDPLPITQAADTPTPRPETSLPEIEKTDPQLRLEPPIPPTTSAASLPPSTTGADRLVSDLPSASVPILRSAPPPAPATPPPAPPDPRIIEEPHVRATLAQFEAAYNNLSAQAAQAVWPTVDERSLARAFDSLESQQVVLGQCSIRIDGAAASADCAGSTSWTPKVGGGRRTESRRWRFDLTKANGAWLIENFQAR